MEKFQRNYIFILGFIVVLTALSYSLNIKEPVLIPDESLRALVGLEMHLSGDYITPKMGGLHYYKKPPIYNWLVAGYYQLTGDYSEMATRVPMLLSLLAFAFAIFHFTQKYFDFRTGVIAALFFVVSLRILSYETLYGLIDITYSLVVFLTIIYTWQLFQKKKYLSLFLITYSLTALSFLMKGIPSIAYQGLTLLLVFIMNKEFKKLFSWQHLLGGVLFLFILSSYYYIYALRNPKEINILLNTIFNESADKSGIAFSFGEVIKHIFSFSIEILYSFIPASFVIIFLFESNSRNFIKKNRFLRFLMLAFLVNISIYLVSPISYMRYVIPHFALFSIPTAAAYFYLKKQGSSRLIRIFDGFFVVSAFIVLIGNFVYGFIPQLDFIEHIWIKILVLTLIILIPTIYVLKLRKYKIELFIIALLVFKLGLNWFIVPSRNQDNFREELRKKSLAIGKEMQGKKAIVYNESLGSVSLFYLTAGKRAIIPKSEDTTGVDYLIGYDFPFDLSDKKLIDQYQIEYFEVPLKIYKLK